LVGLDRFLQTDQRDVGCGEAMRLLHADADLVAHGDDATQGFPGNTAQLRACGPAGKTSTDCWPRYATPLTGARAAVTSPGG
jgi:hypothetical protein